MRQLSIGLLINPFAGIGGALALKGSDGPEIRQQAISAGAERLAMSKVKTCLTPLLPYREHLMFYTANTEMGSDLLAEMGFRYQCIYQSDTWPTEANDSKAFCRALTNYDIDLLLFAGGDGTARDILDEFDDRLPILGIPAGCKIHSGVYAISPQAAGRVLENMLKGELVSLTTAEIRDLDEAAYRAGTPKAKYYGMAQIPAELQYMQAVKMGGKESDELVLDDLAAQIEEWFEAHPDDYFVMGSGSTVAAIMDRLGLPNTLLGIDIVRRGQLLAADVTAKQCLHWVQQGPSQLVLTLIGGQGHVFGRGNQQLSPAVIRAIGLSNIRLISSKQKLQQLAGKPLRSDTGDQQLDQALAGLHTIYTGLHDQVLYTLADL